MATTWQRIIEHALKENNETVKDIVYSFPKWSELNNEFDNNFGRINGCKFTLWTTNHVYFPACYDGAEWVESVPRNPCHIATGHVGGS